MEDALKQVQDSLKPSKMEPKKSGTAEITKLEGKAAKRPKPDPSRWKTCEDQVKAISQETWC